jgi:hypothetical protein
MSSEPGKKALKYKNKYLKLKSNNLNIQSGGEMSLEELARDIKGTHNAIENYGDNILVEIEKVSLRNIEMNDKLNKLNAKLNDVIDEIRLVRIQTINSETDILEAINKY